ncbi:MAG: radical SAM protein [Clostridiales bacterium]
MLFKKTNKINIPFIVYEITPSCNYNCKYCYNIWKAKDYKSPPVSSYSMVKKTLNHLFKKANLDTIAFSGGEPSLFRRLPEIILFCKMKKKQVVLITNGSASERHDYKMLIESGVNLFEIPIHSYNFAEHDKLSGIKNSWKNSVQSVKTILSLKGSVVVVIVITKINYKSLPRTIQFIKELGINQIMLNRFNIGGEGIKQKSEIGLSIKELQKAFKLANTTINKVKIKASSNVCTPFCVLNPENYPNIPFSACYPRELNRSWTLDPEGNIRFCNHSPHIIGNIYKATFEELLQSDYIKEWQEEVPKVCEQCKIYKKCWAGCRAASEQLGFSLKYADPLVYEFLKIPMDKNS